MTLSLHVFSFDDVSWKITSIILFSSQGAKVHAGDPVYLPPKSQRTKKTGEKIEKRCHESSVFLLDMRGEWAQHTNTNTHPHNEACTCQRTGHRGGSRSLSVLGRDEVMINMGAGWRCKSLLQHNKPGEFLGMIKWTFHGWLSMWKVILHPPTLPAPPPPPSSVHSHLYSLLLWSACCPFMNTHRPSKTIEGSDFCDCWDLLIRTFIWRTGFRPLTSPGFGCIRRKTSTFSSDTITTRTGILSPKAFHLVPWIVFLQLL